MNITQPHLLLKIIKNKDERLSYLEKQQAKSIIDHASTWAQRVQRTCGRLVSAFSYAAVSPACLQCLVNRFTDKYTTNQLLEVSKIIILF